MSTSLRYEGLGAPTRTHTLFAQTMAYVAATAALFAAGAYLGRNLLIYSVIGLVIFAGFTMFDFQRLRTNTDAASAPLLAASIFLDILNVFLFFLEIFSGGERS